MDDWLAERFEDDRSHLHAVAYRMLGSASDADDAVQESWLRVSRGGASGVENLTGWLTTVVGRVCLDMLRSRTSRREEPVGVHPPEPTVRGEHATGPEQEALLADSVGLALLVVLDRLAPAERLAFVLHDLFAMPFDEIAPIVHRSVAATRQLASRARRRVRATPTIPDAALAQRRDVVEAFLAAARTGDIGALLGLLDPDVVVRADLGAAPTAVEVRGARPVAEQALTFARRVRFAQPALIDGAIGIIVAPQGRLSTAMTFTVTHGKIIKIDIVADPERLRGLELALVNDTST
jgi:RNA polymerase sigma-70 factor (ECF subfamily)